ncbi:MAG: DMT family transporter [Acidobacteria bacterium]|nr:DMT family transporter [Acidobacteriota bacterium]MBI3281078.1 DMT family transporter [Acidobacteriota bacterium]
MSPPAPWKAELALASVCLIWGSTFVLVKEALQDVSTLLFLTLRFSVAAAALTLLFRGRAAHAPPGSWRGGVITGACLFSGYFVQTLGLRYTTPGKSGFITGLYVVLVPVFAAAVYRKLPQPSEVAGVTLATLGVALLSFDANSPMNRGDVLTLGCAVLYAFHILLLGRYSPVMPVERLAVLQIATGAAIGLVTFWWVETPYLRATPRVWLALAVTSLLATALAFTVQTWAQRYTTATRTALVFALEPVFALLASYVWIREVFLPRALFGAVLILAAILVVEWKPFAARAGT